MFQLSPRKVDKRILCNSLLILDSRIWGCCLFADTVFAVDKLGPCASPVVVKSCAKPNFHKLFEGRF